MIPAVDMRLRLGKQESPDTDRTSVIIAEFEGKPIGLIVDGIEEVVHVPAAEKVAAPKTSRQDPGLLTGLCHLSGGVAMLLDGKRIFLPEELRALNGVHNAV